LLLSTWAPVGIPVVAGTRKRRGKNAMKETGVKKFVFHNYRNKALTEWACSRIPVHVAMKASGHSLVQMHPAIHHSAAGSPTQR
jgi:integrase